MVEAFKRHIREKSLLSPKNKYLLACSGGLDSISLFFLLKASQIPFEVAHVNFMLRGSESDGDHQFIIDLCSSENIPLHDLKKDTTAFKEQNKLSTQEAARKIRYDFFDETLAKKGLDGVITAHHEDDQIETIFINLLRGSGMEGLSGMADRRGNVIRPLLPFRRSEIEDYAKDHDIKWREDSSNDSTDYFRNKLRHEVLPALLGSKEDARKNLLKSFERIKDSSRAFNSLFEEWKHKWVSKEKDLWSLNKDGIRNYAGSQTLLFYWVRGFGFNSSQSKDMHEALILGESGKLFESTTHLANVDRNQLLIGEKESDFESFSIESFDIAFELGNQTYNLLQVKPGDFLDKNPANAMLDLEKLKFPLELRIWEQGDRFNPLGMLKEKKVSDFLIDQKVPFIQKAKVKVLISEGRIAWVLGYRIADWAKVTPRTEQVLYIKQTI